MMNAGGLVGRGRGLWGFGLGSFGLWGFGLWGFGLWGFGLYLTFDNQLGVYVGG